MHPELLMNRNRFPAALLALTVTASLAVTPAMAGPRSKDLENQAAGTTVNVIVRFAAKPSKTMLDKVKANGGTLKKQFTNLPMAVYNLPKASVDAILNNTDVVYASKDRTLKGALDYANPAMNAPIAFSSGFVGTNIGIAVIDSGVNGSHPDLNGRVVYSENFVEGSTSTADPYGHGTHVALIAAGNAAASTGANATRAFRGMAPGAKIVNLRVLDANGTGTDSQLVNAIDRAIALKNTHNIRVINLSLGRPVFESYKFDPLCQAVESAYNAGITVVAAAGNGGRDNTWNNNGYGTIVSPGNDPFVITVGALRDMKTALRSDDVIASYSSKGPTAIDHFVKPDVVAPGNLIISANTSGSTLRTLYADNEVLKSYYLANSSLQASSDYFTLSGTSMATPMVSGAVALMLHKDATLTPNLVKARLMRTASKAFPWQSTAIDPVTGTVYVSQHDIFTVGAGYVDIAAALNDTSTSSRVALSPRAVFSTTSGTAKLDTKWLSGAKIIWGENIIWGQNIIWGESVSGHTLVEGSNIVWGDSSSSGFNIIWGENIIWGASTNFFDMALAARGDR